MAQEAMGVCLCVLKESNKRSFDSYSVWNSVLIISHVTFRDRRVHIFADNLSVKLYRKKLARSSTSYAFYAEPALIKEACLRSI